MSNIRRTIPSGRYTDLSLIDHDDSDVGVLPPIILEDSEEDIDDDIFSTYEDESFNHDDIDEEYDYDHFPDDIDIDGHDLYDDDELYDEY